MDKHFISFELREADRCQTAVILSQCSGVSEGPPLDGSTEKYSLWAYVFAIFTLNVNTVNVTHQN